MRWRLTQGARQPVRRYATVLLNMDETDRVYRVITNAFRQSGIDPLSALDALESHRNEWLPPGYAVTSCGSCKRSSIVPTGQSLKKLRLDGGCTQEEVAALAGCKKSAICDIEVGRRTASERAVSAYYAAIETKKRQPKLEPPPK